MVPIILAWKSCTLNVWCVLNPRMSQSLVVEHSNHRILQNQLWSFVLLQFTHLRSGEFVHIFPVVNWLAVFIQSVQRLKKL